MSWWRSTSKNGCMSCEAHRSRGNSKWLRFNHHQRKHQIVCSITSELRVWTNISIYKYDSSGSKFTLKKEGSVRDLSSDFKADFRLKRQWPFEENRGFSGKEISSGQLGSYGQLFAEYRHVGCGTSFMKFPIRVRYFLGQPFCVAKEWIRWQGFLLLTPSGSGFWWYENGCPSQYGMQNECYPKYWNVTVPLMYVWTCRKKLVWRHPRQSFFHRCQWKYLCLPFVLCHKTSEIFSWKDTRKTNWVCSSTMVEKFDYTDTENVYLYDWNDTLI